MLASLQSLVTTPTGMSWLLAVAFNAGLLVGVAWLCTHVWRHSTAAGRHRLWALGITAALLMPLLHFTLSSRVAQRTLNNDFQNTSQLVANSTHSLAAVMAPAAELATQHIHAEVEASPTWPLWLAVTWAVGALLVAMRFGKAYFVASRLSRGAQPADAATWFAAQRDAANALALTRTVALGRSTAIKSPMTVGVLRPRVLLPAAADAWSAERLHAVLVHELGHIRRRDTLIQFGAQVACILYWWHPLLWLAEARLRSEREHACDDLVLHAGVRPSTYATALLAVARGLRPEQTVCAAATFLVASSGLTTRMQRILDADVSRRVLGAKFQLVAAGAALALAATLACSSPPLEQPASGAARESAASVDAASPTVRGTITLGTAYVEHNRGATGLEPLPFRAPVEQPSAFEAHDLALATSEVQRNIATLLQCYQRQLRKHPALAGRVVIHWTIGADGAVLDQCLGQNTLGDLEVQACVNNLIAHATFPAPRGGALDVTLPFIFTVPL